MEKLRIYLCDAGVTQRSFAEIIGLSRSHLSEIISGRKRPSLDVAFSIERATFGRVPVQSWDMGASESLQDKTISSPNQEQTHYDTPSENSSDAA